MEFIKHGGFQYQLLLLLRGRAAFTYCAKEHCQSSDLKMLQHVEVYVNKETGFSVVMLHYTQHFRISKYI